MQGERGRSKITFLEIIKETALILTSNVLYKAQLQEHINVAYPNSWDIITCSS